MNCLIDGNDVVVDSTAAAIEWDESGGYWRAGLNRHYVPRPPDGRVERLDMPEESMLTYRITADGVVRLTPEAPAPVPDAVSMRQARLALLAAGLLDDVESAVAAAGRAAQIEWEFAAEVRRDHPLIAAMQAQQGLSDGQIDELFRSAAAL